MGKELKTANLPSTWKQEVNRRVAAHMSRKALSVVESEPPSEAHPSLGSRAAKAAERVAARYANAPSFDKALSEETAQSMPAADAAGNGASAHVAPAAATSQQQPMTPAALPPSEVQPDPVQQTAPVAVGSASLPAPAASEPPRKKSRARRPAILNIQEVEPAQPIPANVIRFPRPVVATRKKRPRRAEGPLAVPEAGTQLSIFEIEPETVSTEPSPAVAGEAAAQAWLQPDWPGIELEAPQAQAFAEEAPQTRPPLIIALAPLSRRLMAAVVDAAIVLAAFLAGALLAASKVAELPGPRPVEFTAFLAVLVLSVAYLALFFTVGTATPGMRYAGIQLSTFSGSKPDRAQRCTRLAALILSVAPLGLGLAWALFDEAHLTWHDRLSRTYLRKS